MQAPAMTPDETLVAAWAAANAAQLGLTGPVSARSVWNPGGFVNRSFTVTDGHAKVHVKLGPARREARLRRWASVHRHLEEGYRAPRLLAMVEGGILPGQTFGLAFAHAPGEPLTAETCTRVLPNLLATIGALHRDEPLRTQLGPGSPDSCADAFAALYIRRFQADLKVIAAGREVLTFVPDDVIAWCHEETEALARLASEHPAFQEPAAAPVHRDLHVGNILVDDAGSYTIIDWDDLIPDGDPALDYSLLLWPLRRSGEDRVWRQHVAAVAGEAVAERLELYDRAMLLNEVIDVLADYIEAGEYPEHAERTRQRARALHVDALGLYRSRFGACG